MHRPYLFAAALLRDNWLIDAAQAESLLPMVQAMLDNAQLHRDDDGVAEAKQLDPLFGCFAVQLGADAGTQHFKTFDEAPSGSTAVLSITGPVLKDDFCDVGMNGKAEQIRTAYQHPNINSLLIKFDTPGGQSNAPALVADAIRESRAAGVPVMGWVDHGMSSSAGYWMFASCTEGWLSQPTDQVGSIGAYQRVRKNASTDVLEVYAPQSKQKNLPQRAAAGGDTSLLEAELGELVDEFHLSVQADRGDRLKGDAWREGGQFMGKKAVAEGLADGICSFAQAVQRVQELAAAAGPAQGEQQLTIQPPNLTTNPLTPSLPVKYALVSALLGATTGLAVDKEKGTYLNEAQLDQLETRLTAAAAKETDLTTTTTALGTAQTDLSAATKRATDAEDKLATYANVPGKDQKNPVQTGQDRQPALASAEDKDPYLQQVLAYKAAAGISNGTPAK